MDTHTADFVPGRKYHVFEQAGLGQAPYRYLRCTENLWVSGDGSVRKAGGSCDYCGAGILLEFWLESADGRKFKVGCDCILKADSDKALRVAVETEIQKRKREQRHARAEAKRQKDVARIQAARLRLPDVADAFKSQPHPMAASGPFFASKTLLDWAEWMLANAGVSGALSVAKRIESALEDK
jgi:hypothetical protein